MVMKTMIVMSMILLIVSASMEAVNSDAFDCYDACSTGCVNSNVKLLLRCERKCQKRCRPGLPAFQQVKQKST